MLITLPLAGIILAEALIGVCSRRVPRRGLLVLRLGVAAVVGAVAITAWRSSWLSVEAAAVLLAAIAILYAAAAGRARGRTTVPAASQLV